MKRKLFLISSFAAIPSSNGFLQILTQQIAPSSSCARASHHSRNFITIQNASSKSNQEQNTSNNNHQSEDFTVQNITDEEALLACRAYLQRKNKLGKNGWTKHHKRKLLLENSLALGNNRPLGDVDGGRRVDEGIGYFWEDPAELKYLRTGRPRLYFDDSTTEFVRDFMLEQAEDENDSDWLHNNNQDEEDEDEDVKNALIINDEEENGIFTGFPTMPTREFSIRSNGKKILFQDEEWKRKWYEARWGDLEKERKEWRKNKKIEKFIQQIPSDVLDSDELAALSDAEIEDAIRTYIVANKRRSRAHKKRTEVKRNMTLRNSMEKDVGDGRDGDAVDGEEPTAMKASRKIETTTLDSFMMQLNGSSEANEALAEERQRRSDRAAAAYLTRLENIDAKTKPTSRSEKAATKTKAQSFMAERTETISKKVGAALARIRRSLDKDTRPKSSDIETILQPKRLAGRKNLLQDILLKCFGMRGKCVPSKTFYSSVDSLDVNHTDKKFVTSCSVHELGDFVAYTLRQDEDIS